MQTLPVFARWRHWYNNSVPLFVRTVIGDITRMLVINLACTVFVTYVMKISDALYENFIFSNCIGFSCYLLMRGVSWMIWAERNPRNLWFYLLCTILAPIGVMCGSVLAALFFHYPVPQVLAYQWHYAEGFFVLSCGVSLIAAWVFKSKATMAQLQAESEAEKARAASIERQALQTQLQLLQAQIEPHMLFNTLANLQGLIKLDPDRAQYMLSQLIIYLRATLNIARNSNSTLRQEFDLMRAYLELLGIRMGERLSYTLVLPDTLASLTIPPMLLQPLVENAIKHGLEPKIEGGHLQVRASLEQQSLLIQVCDTGLGLSTQTAPSGEGGVGNNNICERLRAIFGDAASFRLYDNEPEGAIAEIRIPVQP